MFGTHAGYAGVCGFNAGVHGGRMRGDAGDAGKEAFLGRIDFGQDANKLSVPACKVNKGEQCWQNPVTQNQFALP